MNFNTTKYCVQECAVFRRTDDEFGGFSNMSRAFPLKIYGTRIRTTEHLYQAMRFPQSPEIQSEVLEAKKPRAAKLVARAHDDLTRDDWFEVRVNIMRWCLSIKLAQHLTRFGELLDASGSRPIVEFSKRDSFWGAAPDGDRQLVGQNVLGQLLDECRLKLRQARELNNVRSLMAIDPPPGCGLFGLPVEKQTFADDDALEVLLTSGEIYEVFGARPSQSPGFLAAWCRQRQLRESITNRQELIDTLNDVLNDTMCAASKPDNPSAQKHFHNGTA